MVPICSPLLPPLSGTTVPMTFRKCLDFIHLRRSPGPCLSTWPWHSHKRSPKELPHPPQHAARGGRCGAGSARTWGLDLRKPSPWASGLQDGAQYVSADCANRHWEIRSPSPPVALPQCPALTEDGEDDHEEEQQQEDVHEGWQGLEDLPQVAGETDRLPGEVTAIGGCLGLWGMHWSREGESPNANALTLTPTAPGSGSSIHLSLLPLPLVWELVLCMNRAGSSVPTPHTLPPQEPPSSPAWASPPHATAVATVHQENAAQRPGHPHVGRLPHQHHNGLDELHDQHEGLGTAGTTLSASTARDTSH